MKINFVVFIIEDDSIYGEILEYQFALNPNCVVRRFKAGKEALARPYYLGLQTARLVRCGSS